MPVDSTHPAYDELKPVWQRIRDAIKGSRAIKAAKEEYLPKASPGQTVEDYNAYQARAVWFGATAKTAVGYVGIITRKPITLTHPESLQPFIDNCDLRGTPFVTYAQTVTDNLVTAARCGTLLDWTAEGRPYVTHYDELDIINWEYTTINGEKKLSFVMLHELSTTWDAQTGQPAPDDYEHVTYDQWREFRLVLDDKGQAVKVVMTLHRVKWETSATKRGTARTPKGRTFLPIKTVEMKRRGAFVTSIPFTIHTASQTSPEECAKPMLEDLVDLNIAHYMASADIWNGRHMAGLPTPWARRFTDEKTTSLSLGTGRAWISDDKDAMCGFLEMKGDALKSIKDGMEELETQMAAIGARAIEPQKKDAEAVGTVMLRSRAETASLVILAEQAGRSLSLVMQWAAWIGGTEASPQDLAKSVYAVIQTDLVSGKLDAATLSAYVAAYQSGAMSFETFFNLCQAGEMYPDARTMEEEQTALEQQRPAPPMSEQEEAELETARAAAAAAKSKAGGAVE